MGKIIPIEAPFPISPRKPTVNQSKKKTTGGFSSDEEKEKYEQFMEDAEKSGDEIRESGKTFGDVLGEQMKRRRA